METDKEFLFKVFSKKANDNVSILNSKDHPKIKGRKETRKDQRKEIKIRKHVNFLKRKGKSMKDIKQQHAVSNDGNKTAATKKKKKRKSRKKQENANNEETPSEVPEPETYDEWRKESLAAANAREEKHIAHLEKKLGIKKIKKDKISNLFSDDGLDYLLELCEPSDNQQRNDDEESGDEIDPTKPETEMQRFLREKRFKKASSKTAIGANSEDYLLSSEMESDDSDAEGQDELLASDDDELSCEENHSIEESDEESDEPHPKKQKQTEDNRQQRYIPPTLRKKHQESKQSQSQIHLHKQIKGLLNRLSEANLISISRNLMEIYSKNSHTECNNLLSKIVIDACVLPTLSAEKMVIDYVMLVVLLHAHVGTDVGAQFLEVLADKFVELHGSGLRITKECDNVVLLIVLFYKFKIVQSVIVFDLLTELVKEFTERDVEIILLILKTVGFDIRKDNPISLQGIIKEVQMQAEANQETAKRSRVKFMLEMINAIKNNNAKKVPQYDPSVHVHAQKVLKQLIGSKVVVGDMELRVTMDDLRNAKNRGRWWIVGSAWSGVNHDSVSSSLSQNLNTDTQNSKVLELAKKHRMNTDARRQVFCAVMTSEDYLDAFEKVIKLNLKDKQSRDIVYVVMDCCLREKNYNPYYSYLTEKLCEFSRSNQVTFQYLTWDRLKQISDMPLHSRKNLARLMAHLFTSSAVSISILKVVSYPSLKPKDVKFFADMFNCIFGYPEATVKATFSRISSLTKLSLLRESIKVFMRKHMWPKEESVDDKMKTLKLKEIIQVVEACLDGRDFVPL